MEILPYFDSKKLNAKINRKDRIQYEKIIVDCSSTKEGLIHIIERHIYDVVEAYSRLVLNDQGSNYLESFMREQNLSQDFKLYAASLSRIAEELYQLRRFFFSDFRYEDFIKSFYGKIDTKDLKRFYVGREQQTFGCKVDELQNQLRTARKIISDEEKQKLYECLLEVAALFLRTPIRSGKTGMSMFMFQHTGLEKTKEW
jgi:hypothetical protein